MDQRTIGQILTNPEWLRQTYGEDRTIQQQPQTGATYVPTPAPYYDYQQPAPQAQQPVPVRPESRPVEVRGQIAYVARYRAEYYNPHDQPTMMTLAQSVIMNQTGAEPGEDPPPWFPDVQFWIQSFEEIDPYATAQQAELQRLKAQAAERAALEQRAHDLELKRREEARTLSRDELIFGHPAPDPRGVVEPAPIAEQRELDRIAEQRGQPDWLADILREVFVRIDDLGVRLEAMGRGAGHPAGADPAVHADADRPGDPDRAGRDGADARAARGDSEERMAVAPHPEVAADEPGDVQADAAWDSVPEPGDGAAAADPGPRANRGRRYTSTKKGS